MIHIGCKIEEFYITEILDLLEFESFFFGTKGIFSALEIFKILTIFSGCGAAGDSADRYQNMLKKNWLKETQEQNNLKDSKIFKFRYTENPEIKATEEFSNEPIMTNDLEDKEGSNLIFLLNYATIMEGISVDKF